MKRNLYIMVGIPGSGKSTYILNHLDRRQVRISRDEIRFSMINSKDEYFRKEKLVYNEFVRLIQEALNEGYDVYADATHINWNSRRRLLSHLDLTEVNVHIIYINKEIDTCLAQNAGRQNLERVPEEAIKQMAERFTPPWEDPFEYKSIREVFEDGEYIRKF